MKTKYTLTITGQLSGEVDLVFDDGDDDPIRMTIKDRKRAFTVLLSVAAISFQELFERDNLFNISSAPEGEGIITNPPDAGDNPVPE